VSPSFHARPRSTSRPAVIAGSVRRVPASLEQLQECWGFGGSGVRLQKYGDYFLEALRPHGASIKAAHESAKVEATRIEAGEEKESDEEDVPLALRRQRKTCAEAAERRLAEARPVASEVMEVEEVEDEDEEVKEVEEVQVNEEAEDPHIPIPESVDDLFHHELPYFHELVEWKRARGERWPCVCPL
jgi:hypothetical protein